MNIKTNAWLCGLVIGTARVEQSCEQIGSSGTYVIDPDGSGPLQAVQVDCEIEGNFFLIFVNCPLVLPSKLQHVKRKIASPLI